MRSTVLGVALCSRSLTLLVPFAELPSVRHAWHCLWSRGLYSFQALGDSPRRIVSITPIVTVLLLVMIMCLSFCGLDPEAAKVSVLMYCALGNVDERQQHCNLLSG